MPIGSSPTPAEFKKKPTWLKFRVLRCVKRPSGVETVEAKWNRLAGADPEAIKTASDLSWVGSDYPSLFGDGHAAGKIIQILAG